MRFYADREQSLERIRSLFQDPNPRVRKIAARKVMYAHLAIKRDLFSLMFFDANEDIRTYAIHIAHELDFVNKLKEAAFDRRNNVRFYAREYLIQRGIKLQFRKLALQGLQQHSKKIKVLGYLGSLSEWGRREDIPMIETFLQDPRSKVRKEARRTISWIQFASA